MIDASNIEILRPSSEWGYHTHRDLAVFVWNFTVKKCSTCEEYKEAHPENFYRDRSKSDGFNTVCKKCASVRDRKYREDNRSVIRKRKRDYYTKNLEAIKTRDRIYYENNKEKKLEYAKKYRGDNKEKLSASHKRWAQENKDYVNSYKRRMYKEDPNFAIAGRIRNRVRDALAGKDKSASTQELTGCDWKFLVKYIASLFTDGMSWENRSEWHIDHIKPCSSFNLVDPEEQRKCFHYTNLQPLWAEDNLKKGAKF